MPQYAYTINGQRHVFEGPDPQTTAQFAQRWAAQEAGRTPVTTADIQARLGHKPSQFAMDVGSRVNQDVGDLTSSINDVRAHPASLLNAPKLLGAVARYVPNAFGLLPAAGVDQMTGPVVRGINRRFGTQYDPHGVTDQLLNGAGLLAGSGEASAVGEGAMSLASGLGDVPVSLRRIVQRIRGPQLRVAYTAPKEEPWHPLGQNSSGENVVPLSDSFLESHNIRKEALSDLPEDLQDKYIDPIEDLVFNPILDDPDYGGHNMATIKNIESQLNDLASAHRSQGGANARIGDAFAEANESLRTMVAEQQPEIAKQLGYLPQEPGPTWAASPRPIPPKAGEKPADVMRFEQYIEPPESAREQERSVTPEELEQFSKLSPDHRQSLLAASKMVSDAANDNDVLPLPDGVVAMKKFHPTAPTPVAQPAELTPQSSTAWLKTAANDNLGARPRAFGVRQTLANAFADPVSFGRAIAARAPNLLNRDDFNALRPSPQWVLPSIVAAGTQPQDPQQPQN
jgi:hypothetical protein